MEDGPDDLASSAVIPSPIKNGEPDDDGMANFPNTDNSAPTSPLKVNGDSNPADNDEKDSSDCDALVIDEGVDPLKKKPKLNSEAEEFRHTNPYFSESIFELSSQYKPQEDNNQQQIVRKFTKANAKKFRGKNGKPKLREYAQYLGLQPTVQFKCSKCYSTGFPSLQILNEHLSTCTGVAPINTYTAPLSNNSTNIRVTRKVFLCSACGTYYENWNLFLHMREVHKRFICLYCLGMFPHPEKLSLHLVSKHNCLPGRYDNITDFFNIYKDPCFLMCCDCQSVFNEQENFINHGCIENEAAPAIAAKDISDAGEAKETVVAEITEPCKTDDKQMSESKVNVERLEEERIQEEDCVNSKESDSNSEVNMIENENVLETSDNSVEDKGLENEDENAMNLSEPENVNSNAVHNKSDVSEDSDNKMNDHSETDEPNVVDCDEAEEEEEEVRKVPKVTLRLPKITTPYNLTEGEEEEEDYQSEDSEKLTMEIEKENSDVEVTNENLEDENVEDVREDVKDEITVPTAGVDIAIIELELEQPLDKFDIKLLLQKCLRSTIGTCLYCNHARKIAVNGKQLGLHAIAEHRYSAIVKSITAEELIPESFNTRIKESLDELESVFFNLECTTSEGGITFSHIFECFQCRYSTTVHKELYLHNRKLHAKAILLCIMCKTSFYSYCELICHLCPGLYALENDVHFRCCLCVGDDLPSAFRLMVHLRKKHHVCDVCLEMCHDQSRLSNHVWKHKLHHLCYRCGIAYRNKPDITKHLYWKHGTESVMCKKCLQKKWPHVYHFCIPPGSFTCEECNLSFTRAVSLMVHKRLHLEVFPHSCNEEGCEEKFISKKLLAKHEFKHRQPVEEVKKEEENKIVAEVAKEKPEIKEDEKDINIKEEAVIEEKPVEKPKPKVDVYDLPELNLSESDSSDSEDEIQKVNPDTLKPESNNTILELAQADILKTEETTDSKLELEDKPIPVLENIWDDFKNYQANIAKLDILTDVGKDSEQEIEQPDILTDIEPPLTQEVALRDHDYCAPTMDTLKEEEGLPTSQQQQDMSADHDYCNAGEQKQEEKTNNNVPNHKQNNKDSSDSSSNSDSSSCTCGSNCSCSSASSSSSSSSDSSESDSSSEEGRRRQQVRRERRRQKKTKKETENTTVDVEAVPADNNIPQPIIPLETPIQESDLDTTESDTDEDFYDKQPQKLASKLIAEKREKLLQMAGIGPYINGSMIDSRPSTPSLLEEVKPKKKSKSKKKKKRKSSKHDMEAREVNNLSNNYPVVNPLTLVLPKNSPISTPVYSPTITSFTPGMNLPSTGLISESDSNTRASKRRRVPNKFYGYSSDEEGEKLTPLQQTLKMRKIDLPTPKSPLIVPPLTIKAAPSTPTVEPISIRMSSKPGEMKVQPLRLPFTKRATPKLKPVKPPPPPTPVVVPQEQDSGSDSNSSSSDDEGGGEAVKPKEQPALYCYCRCPYDEVSEMIGCDSDDCAIEWFHFECVGIMVPPKGQWYCPDCRKKKQQRRESFQAQMSS